MIPHGVVRLEEQNAVGAALLLGEWWRAATLLQLARTRTVSRQRWTAWLCEIPVSEQHASKLVRIADQGLASPALSYREAYALTTKYRGWDKA